MFYNGSPEQINLGMDDKSARQAPLVPERAPQHCTKHYLYTRKGPTTSVLTSAERFRSIYGIESLDRDLPYFNHATEFAVGAMTAPSSVVIHRVVPKDAGVRSNKTLYIDIVSDAIPNYSLNSDGSRVIDSLTNQFVVGINFPTRKGHRIKWITEVNDSGVDNVIGNLKPKNGTMVSSTGVVSTMYPIIELQAKYQGEYYNNIGISIENLIGDELDTNISDSIKALPYKLSIYSRVDSASQHYPVRSLYGEPSVMFTFLPNTKNPQTLSRFDFTNVVNTQWYNEVDELKPIRYNDFEGIHLYSDNLQTTLTTLMSLEANAINNISQTWADGITGTTAAWYDTLSTTVSELLLESNLINPITGKSSNGTYYRTLEIDTSPPTLVGTQKEVTLGRNAPIFLEGGSDGTLNNANFEEGLLVDVLKYGDPNSSNINTATNVDSWLYDPGFTLATKLELYSYIVLRKDTNLVLSTHDASLGVRDLPLSDARAIGVALRTRLALAPESIYFGTGTSRAFIICGTGKRRDELTDNRIALSYELLVKASKMMGVSDYIWDADLDFSYGPKAVFTDLIDITPPFIPEGIKPTLWNDGLVWPQSRNRVDYSFAAIQSVYSNDTSILNGIFPNAAAGTLVRLSNETALEFSGNSLNPEVFISLFRNALNDKCEGIFSGLKVINEVVIDGGDELRGYSYHVINKIYGNTMRTKMIQKSEIYRMSDYQATN